MIYTVNFSKKAFKELAKINDPYYSNLKQAILNLTINPRPQGYKKLIGRDGYRIRVGSYRIVYQIYENQLVINIITLGHRKNVYE